MSLPFLAVEEATNPTLLDAMLLLGQYGHKRLFTVSQSSLHVCFV
jgi:hypothetical protein